MKNFARKTLLSASLAAVLSACAGGGGVQFPSAPAVMPPVKALSPSDVKPLQGQNKNQPVAYHSNPAVGTLKAENIPVVNTFGTNHYDKFIYETADGRKYPLLAQSNVFAPTSGVNTTRLPTEVHMSATPEGDRFIVCCDNGSSRFAPGYVGDHGSSYSNPGGMRYGVWMTQAGAVDMFYGGTPATAAEMLGAAKNGGTPTGKATYEVLAFRVRNGKTYASTHDTDRTHNGATTQARSLLTVNFNSNKVGGTIRGNTDFGDDIVFGNVSVNGNRFSGDVTSGSAAGQVEGGFFGNKGYYNPSGGYIGGRATFSGNGELDSVFGGSMRGRGNDSYTGTDTDPL